MGPSPYGHEKVNPEAARKAARARMGKGGKVKTIWQFPAGMVFGAIVAAMILSGPLGRARQRDVVARQRDVVDILDQLYTCRLDLAHASNQADEFAHLLAKYREAK